MRVEPRVMAVLLYLAERPKQVISTQELFEALWPKTQFNPGVVQRCIAQLRKALQDEQNNLILTHPRRGYSLEVTPEPITDSNIQASPLPLAKLSVIGLVVALVIVMFLGPLILVDKPAFSGQLSALTSSGHYDFYPVEANDGRVFFIRQQTPSTHIFQLQPKTQEMAQLTNVSANYQSISWHEESSTLFYSVEDEAQQRVGSLTFKKGVAPINTTLFELTQPGRIWKLLPTDEYIYYMLAQVPLNRAPVTQIMRFNSKLGRHQAILTSSQAFTPYRLALSPNHKQMAIAGEAEDNQVQLRLFDLETQRLALPFATLPLGYTEIDWHSETDQLLVHHRNRLYLAALSGALTPLPFEHFQRLFNPKFSADGAEILMAVSQQDSDIWRYRVSDEALAKVIDSTYEDQLPRLAPDGEAIAFVSYRTGKQQVFVNKESNTKLVFINPENLPIYRAPVWSPDGQLLAFQAGAGLYFYDFTNDTLTHHKMASDFTSVLDWYHDGQHLLLATKSDNVSQFAKYNLITKDQRVITNTGVNFFARLNRHDKLMFVQEGKGQLENESLALLANSLSNDRLFPTKGGIVYQQGAEIWQINEGQDQASLLYTATSGQQLLDVSLDGETLLFGTFEPQHSHIVRMN